MPPVDIQQNIQFIGTEPHPKAGKYTPFETLVNLKEKHPKLSARHLGKLVGISGQAVLQMFSRHGIDYVSGQVTAIEEYKVNRADILAVKQIDCLNSLSAAKLKAASAKDLGVLFGIMYDKERLERGQSTQNIATIMASTVIEAGRQWGKQPVDNSEGPQDVGAEVIEAEDVGVSD